MPEFVRRVRTHLVPLAFFLGAVSVLIPGIIDIAFSTDFSQLMAPEIGVFIGIVYLILGGIYEWSIQAQQRNKKRYQQYREQLNAIEFPNNDEE